ncbi:MAG: M48 family metalloprotease [Thermoplasmatota archaeon]
MEDRTPAILRGLAGGVVLASLTAFAVHPFSPPATAPSAGALFLVGLVLGAAIGTGPAVWLMTAGVLSVLSMGAGYAAGAALGGTGGWVAGALLASLFLSLYLPTLRTVQRALLAALVTVAVGCAGAFLGHSIGATLPLTLVFLAAGLFLSVLSSEEGAMALALHSILAVLAMGLGYAAALFTGGAHLWVPLFFLLSFLTSLFVPPSAARLLMLLLVPPDVFAAFGYIIGGPVGLSLPLTLVFLALGGAFDLLFYYVSDARILRSCGARVVEEAQLPRPHAILRALASRAGVPPPRLALIESDAPNLFSVGRSPGRAVVALTTGLLDAVSEEELEALLAHELAHIRDRDLVTATMASALAAPAGGAARPLMHSPDRELFPLTLAALAVLAPFFALLLHLSTPRGRERRADEAAALMTSKGLALADALEKLEAGAGQEVLRANPATAPLFAVNPFRRGWLSALFTSHPPTEERVRALRRSSAGAGG